MIKNFIVAITILVLLFGPLPVVKPPIAKAIPVIDVANLVQNILQYLEFVWAEVIKPALETALKKQILDVLVDQIITYIQGGGKPQFITDWRGFLADAGNQAAGELIQEAGLGFLCSPFSLQVQLALLPPVRKFSQRAQCTLDQITGNIQSFYNDFRNGGWISYGAAWQPQNNFFGAFLMASETSQAREESARSASSLEALAGNGFLSARDSRGNIITPGKSISDLVSKAIGSDIDFVLSTDELGEYAGAIVSALINRVLTEGLAQIQPSQRDQNTIDAANAALEASVVANTFNPIKTSTINRINETLAPRQQAQSTIDAAIAKLNDYKTSLNKLLTDFTNTGKTSCQPGNFLVSDVKAAIQAEINQADVDINNLLAKSDENHAITDPLQSALDEVNALQPSSAYLSRLNQISNDVTQYLDAGAAEEFKSAMQNLSASISQNINDKLAKFNQQLQQCRTSS